MTVAKQPQAPAGLRFIGADGSRIDMRSLAKAVGVDWLRWQYHLYPGRQDCKDGDGLPTWSLTANQVMIFLSQVQPYLSKAQQRRAALILEAWEHNPQPAGLFTKGRPSRLAPDLIERLRVHKTAGTPVKEVVQLTGLSRRHIKRLWDRMP